MQSKLNVNEALTDYSFLSRNHYIIKELFNNDIEFVTEFPCLLGHPVHFIFAIILGHPEPFKSLSE